MANSEPFEIIAAPFEMYVAPVGTAFPLIDAAPAVDWVKVGTSGNLNISDAGVTIAHHQATKIWRSLGDAGARKIFRTEEDLLISFELADISLEQYQIALNSNPVTTVAAGIGTAGYKKLGLSRGLGIATRALLLRGVDSSAYGEAWTAQYEVPLAQQTGDPKVVITRSDPAMLALEWTALVDFGAASPDERFGRLVMQTADALAS